MCDSQLGKRINKEKKKGKTENKEISCHTKEPRFIPADRRCVSQFSQAVEMMGLVFNPVLYGERL